MSTLASPLLIVPDALLPESVVRSVFNPSAGPSLGRLFSRARREEAAGLAASSVLASWEHWILRDQPAANSARLHVDEAWRGDARAPAWLLHPVHLELGAQGAVLTDPASLELTEPECAALATSIEDVLAGAGFALSGTGETTWRAPWVATRTQALDLSGWSLDAAIGRNAALLTPQGDESAQRLWRRTHNEIQMTWHDHPVNRAREARGQVPVNGLWLSGNGAPIGPSNPHAARPGRDAMLDAFTKAVRAEDAGLLAQAYGELEARVARRLAALRAGRLPSAVLVLCGQDGWRAFTVRRRDLACLWRRADPIACLSES